MSGSRAALSLMLFFVISTLEYILIGAIARKNYQWDLVWRIFISLVMGIVTVVLFRILEQLTSILLIYPPIVLALSGFTILTILFLQFRRLRASKIDLSISEKGDAPLDSIKMPKIPGSRIDKILTVILIISIIVAIGMTVYVIVTPKEGEKFTEFYILGMNGTASEYPTEVMAGEVAGVIIGVVNHEYSNRTYSLKVKINETVVGEESIYLMHNETWEEPFEFSLNETGEDQKLEFLLYIQDVDEVYRSLHLWVDVTESIKQEVTLPVIFLN
ncbi:MAG: DUF1616 domain-containing protein [Halobacteriota archaeon]|nr:DUF1616 domain-containing protein [Halobacteriota archaeon]